MPFNVYPFFSAGMNNPMASPLAMVSPARTSPSRLIREHLTDNRPQRPSPLVLSPAPQPTSKQVTSDNSEGKSLEEVNHPQEAPEGVDSNGKPQRPGKGQRYKEFIAVNGIKQFKKDRKVCCNCLLTFLYS